MFKSDNTVVSAVDVLFCETFCNTLQFASVNMATVECFGRAIWCVIHINISLTDFPLLFSYFMLLSTCNNKFTRRRRAVWTSWSSFSGKKNIILNDFSYFCFLSFNKYIVIRLLSNGVIICSPWKSTALTKSNKIVNAWTHTRKQN